MSGLNQLLSRPGSGIPLPAATRIDPAGLCIYAAPAGDGYEFYEVPVSRLHGAKTGTATSGTAQVVKLVYTSAVGAAGTGTLTVSLTSAALKRTVTATTATLANNATTTQIATAVALALNTALTADDDLLVTVTSSAAELIVTGGAVADATLAFAEVSRTVTSGAAFTASAQTTAATLGTPADYLGQQSINGATVQVATSVRNNTWTAVN